MEFIDYYPGCILIIEGSYYKGSLKMHDDGWFRFSTHGTNLSKEQKLIIKEKLKELNKPLEEATQDLLKNLKETN